MPKSTKTFVLSTSALNSHGFRMLTSGADLSEFLLNPQMYWMHRYPNEDPKFFPIGFWEDIKIVGDEITAVPNFNDDDELSMKIYRMVEHGTLRAASAGAEPVELDSNPNSTTWLPGQTKPTFVKWKLKEASIVDRGANTNAVAKLHYNARFTMNTLQQLSSISTNGKTGYNPSNDTKLAMQNAVAVRKFDSDYAAAMLAMVTDKDTEKTVTGIIRSSLLKVSKLSDMYRPAILDIASKSLFDLKRGFAGDLTSLKEHAPELYAARYYEDCGKMPVMVDGKYL